MTYEPLPLAGGKFSSNSYTGGSVPAAFDTFLYRATGVMDKCLNSGIVQMNRDFVPNMRAVSPLRAAGALV